MIKKFFSKNKSQKPTPKPNLPPLPKTYEALVEMGFNHTQSLMQAHINTWHLDAADQYDLDLEAGEIIWFFPDKIVRAPAQLLGTWSGQDNTFLWGWDHPSAPAGTALAARALKDYADKHNIEQLKDRKQACDFEAAWNLAAMAVLLGDLQGVYRFQASETAWVYVGFGNVTIARS